MGLPDHRVLLAAYPRENRLIIIGQIAWTRWSPILDAARTLPARMDIKPADLLGIPHRADFRRICPRGTRLTITANIAYLDGSSSYSVSCC